MPWVVLPTLEKAVLCAAFLVSLATLATLPRARGESSPPPPSAPWLELVCLAVNIVALVFAHGRAFGAWEEARDAHFVRIHLALFGIFEQLPALLIAIGVLLPTAAIASALRWWRRGRARGGALVLVIALFVMGAVTPFVTTGRDYLDAVADAHTDRRAGLDGPALEQARSRFGCGARVASLAIVGAVVLLGLARRRDVAPAPGRAPAPSWTLTLGLVAVGVAGVVVLSGRARALAAENAHPIPTTHAFADLSLSIAPPLGVEGVGPDDLVEGPLVDVRLDEVTVDGTATERGELLAMTLRSKRELRAAIDPSLPPAIVVVDVGPAVPVAQLARSLDAVRESGHAEVRFRLVDVRREQRPVLGVLRGLAWSAVAATLVARASECTAPPVHVARLPGALASSEELLRELVAARRNQLPICVVTRER